MIQSTEDFMIVSYLLVTVVCAIVFAGLGKDRRVGALTPFLVTLFLSPLVGLIVLLASPTLNDLAIQKKRHEELKAKNSTTSKAEELERLIRLRDAGELTVQEFEKMKGELV